MKELPGFIKKFSSTYFKTSTGRKKKIKLRKKLK